MTERAWPWRVAAVVMLAAAGLAGYSTYLNWLPCRGQLLNGSAFVGYSYPVDFTPACLRAMDSTGTFATLVDVADRVPGAAEWGLLATGLLAIAWLVLVLGQRWSGPRWIPLVLTAPGLATAVMAASGGYALVTGMSTDDLWADGVFAFTTEVLAIGALAVALDAVPGRDRRLVWYLIPAWGCTAAGGIHVLGDYLIMTMLSDANWDAPPGTGYLTVVVIALSAVLTFFLAPRRASRTSLPAAPVGQLNYAG